MIDAFYTAATGTSQLQKGMDIIANNIANVSTYGYKSSQSAFSDLLYTNIRPDDGITTNGMTTQTPNAKPTPEGTLSANDRLKVGHGSKMTKTDVLFTPGNFQNTGRAYDYALQKDGFFAVETTNGIKYTRDGNFQKTQLGGKFYLTSSHGGCILDANGKRIEVKNDTDNLPIGVFTFPNQDGLTREAGMLFNANEVSGQAKALAETGDNLKQFYLEGSNVDMATSFSEVITMQRSFQFNAKMVSTADEIMQTINNLR